MMRMDWLTESDFDSVIRPPEGFLLKLDEMVGKLG